MTSADVFAFLGQQRAPRHENVVRIKDGEAGLEAQTQLARPDRARTILRAHRGRRKRDDAGRGDCRGQTQASLRSRR